MKIEKYSPNTGIVSQWEGNSKVITNYNHNVFLIQANKEGLISLGYHLLSLAQKDVPVGTHIHYDDYSSLEDGSTEFIIDKID